MFSHKLTRLPKNTIELEVIIPTPDIQIGYGKAFDKLHQDLEIEGFRKGKAPKAIAEKHLKKDVVYKEAIRAMLPDIYEEIVKKENLKPLVSPKVELVEAKEGADWKVKITVAEKPLIDLGNYQENVKKVKANAKTDDIWVPGKNDPAAAQGSDEAKQAKDQKLLNDVLTELLKSTKCEISDMILEEEKNRKLTQIVDDIQKIGLTVDGYLKSKNLTMEDLRARVTQEIEETYKIEFILMEIAEKEGIQVEDKDLSALFANIKDEKEKQSAQANAYFYASVLRKQKTIEFLMSL